MESVTQKKIKASELRSLGDRRTEQQADSVAETDRGEDAITSQDYCEEYAMDERIIEISANEARVPGCILEQPPRPFRRPAWLDHYYRWTNSEVHRHETGSQPVRDAAASTNDVSAPPTSDTHLGVLGSTVAEGPGEGTSVIHMPRPIRWDARPLGRPAWIDEYRSMETPTAESGSAKPRERNISLPKASTSYIARQKLEPHELTVKCSDEHHLRNSQWSPRVGDGGSGSSSLPWPVWPPLDLNLLRLDETESSSAITAFRCGGQGLSSLIGGERIEREGLVLLLELLAVSEERDTGSSLCQSKHQPSKAIRTQNLVVKEKLLPDSDDEESPVESSSDCHRQRSNRADKRAQQRLGLGPSRWKVMSAGRRLRVERREVNQHKYDAGSSLWPDQYLSAMSSAAASIPPQDRPKIEDLSPEYQEVVKEVARRLGQAVENEIVTGLSQYILARATAAANLNVDEEEVMEDDEDKENQAPEPRRAETEDTEDVATVPAGQHGGDVHTEEDLAMIAEHFRNITTHQVQARTWDDPDADKENVPLQRPDVLQVDAIGPFGLPLEGVYYESWVSDMIDRAQRFEFRPSRF
ncbi:hypothetical protein GLOTRDRAFT_93643 [Gloeophyllum trabeum ATCC 11539]|uniref:Uncharacterized protein n=1 Tax=Gloeophyllum trabeum (strain ATCC 11539 / FP-39264 / Madison 617) TaxID=670483 RepID=S7Q6G4_GLOTA|nr:uncharacterized protein GLOTRDRAFT_93643 [Gloeophyllum trabeum ATCC 11539]EPQ55102.1 hypothetical protein GLOTRDRAFT_93643 [Gloeophyllum trabeum ATCC 11539]